MQPYLVSPPIYVLSHLSIRLLFRRPLLRKEIKKETNDEGMSDDVKLPAKMRSRVHVCKKGEREREREREKISTRSIGFENPPPHSQQSAHRKKKNFKNSL